MIKNIMAIILLVASIVALIVFVAMIPTIQAAMYSHMEETIVSSLEGMIERDLDGYDLNFVLTDLETVDGAKGIIIYDDDGNVISTNVRGLASEKGST